MWDEFSWLCLNNKSTKNVVWDEICEIKYESSKIIASLSFISNEINKLPENCRFEFNLFDFCLHQINSALDVTKWISWSLLDPPSFAFSFSNPWISIRTTFSSNWDSNRIILFCCSISIYLFSFGISIWLKHTMLFCIWIRRFAHWDCAQWMNRNKRIDEE